MVSGTQSNHRQEKLILRNRFKLPLFLRPWNTRSFLGPCFTLHETVKHLISSVSGEATQWWENGGANGDADAPHLLALWASAFLSPSFFPDGMRKLHIKVLFSLLGILMPPNNTSLSQLIMSIPCLLLPAACLLNNKMLTTIFLTKLVRHSLCLVHAGGWGPVTSWPPGGSARSRTF